MNEKIKKLYEKALGTDEYGFKFDPEKFAMLIVQECIGVADYSNVTGKSIIGERIKQHFGVEL